MGMRKFTRKRVPSTFRMWCRAQLLVLLTTVTIGYSQDYGPDENTLKVGRSIDIFTRYGYLSLSIKVVPRNDTTWIFREPTIDIFNGIDPFAVYPTRMNRKQIFDGDFHMEFCDNLKQLLQAYFRHFMFERLDKPWLAFTGSWASETIARNLGINSSFIHKDHCYVLVRLSRFRTNAELTRVPNNVNLVDVVAREIDNIKVGDVASVIMFIRKYGSHYIHSYTTGNSIYQVFVYRKPVYKRIKERLSNRSVKKLESMDLRNFFSPWYADHMGEIKVASGNTSVERWASAKLRVNYYIFSYPSLLKLHGDNKLLLGLNNILRNEAILELDMRTLAPAFKDPQKRRWFEEVLDNYLKLWESNL
ncbi:torso-like protein isoform X1 [Harmonia axyridis]|uniref:torso-like protein isoform X1 n=2 Tax=Harmonia axyridis TaxID=115357 RepID=UPI001E2790FB|nr:torso-like protein isoform X1 [Harmonia axyridis]